MFYAGIGSRETPQHVMQIMQEFACIAEQHGYILRSGGAGGADSAFAHGIKNNTNRVLYIPYNGFNGLYHNGADIIHIDHSDIKNYERGYNSLVYHPMKFKINNTARAMMIRNYFQAMGLYGDEPSKFVVVWTDGGANGTTILTTREDGGGGQCIRIAAANNIPVYNLKDDRYNSLSAEELFTCISNNLKSNIQPDLPRETYVTTKLF